MTTHVFATPATLVHRYVVYFLQLIIDGQLDAEADEAKAFFLGDVDEEEMLVDSAQLVAHYGLASAHELYLSARTAAQRAYPGGTLARSTREPSVHALEEHILRRVWEDLVDVPWEYIQLARERKSAEEVKALCVRWQSRFAGPHDDSPLFGEHDISIPSDLPAISDWEAEIQKQAALVLQLPKSGATKYALNRGDISSHLSHLRQSVTEEWWVEQQAEKVRVQREILASWIKQLEDHEVGSPMWVQEFAQVQAADHGLQHLLQGSPKQWRQNRCESKLMYPAESPSVLDLRQQLAAYASDRVATEGLTP